VRIWLTKDPIRDTGCSLKAFDARYAKRMKMFKGTHRFLTTLVRMQGGAIVEIDVNHRPRPKGTPKYGQGLGRTFTALRDAFAVRWMKSRVLNYETASCNVSPSSFGWAATSPSAVFHGLHCLYGGHLHPADD
jgi:hypothetical protein